MNSTQEFNKESVLRFLRIVMLYVCGFLNLRRVRTFERDRAVLLGYRLRIQNGLIDLRSASPRF